MVISTTKETPFSRLALNKFDLNCRTRRIGLNIVRLMDDDYPLKGRMEIAAMSDKYLLGMLANAIGKF